MEKKTAGLIGALAGLATMGSAQAASQAPPHPDVQSPEQLMRVASYADLLKPIPNAAEIMRAQQAQPPVQKAQYYQDQRPEEHHHHHHHHHHHAYYPPPHHHHHHHHHHQSGLTVVIPGVGVVRN
jgi:G3E family GTPase